MHHRSCNRGGLCPGGSLARGSLSGGSLSGGSLSIEGLFPEGVSVHGGSLSRGGSLSGGLCQGDPPKPRPTDRDSPFPLYRNEWAVCILLECILVKKELTHLVISHFESNSTN